MIERPPDRCALAPRLSGSYLVGTMTLPKTIRLADLQPPKRHIVPGTPGDPRSLLDVTSMLGSDGILKVDDLRDVTTSDYRKEGNGVVTFHRNYLGEDGSFWNLVNEVFEDGKDHWILRRADVPRGQSSPEP